MPAPQPPPRPIPLQRYEPPLQRPVEPVQLQPREIQALRDLLAGYGVPAPEHPTHEPPSPPTPVAREAVFPPPPSGPEAPPRVDDRQNQDTTIRGSTLVPVRLTRADGQRTILAYVDVPTSYVVEGAEAGERVIGLPATDEFYDARGGGLCAFQLTDATDNVGPKVNVWYGEINGAAPSGLSIGNDYLIVVSNGDRIYAVIAYDTETFAITSRTLNSAADVPENELGLLHVVIGRVSIDGEGLTVWNTHCGDINFTFDFGGLNGKPAVKCTPFGDWVEIPDSEA